MTSRIILSALAILLASVSALTFVDLDDNMAKVIIMVSLFMMVMIAGVAFSRDRRIPLLCDPLFLTFAFLSQFYVIGAIGMQVWGPLSGYFSYKFTPDRAIYALTAGVITLVMATIGYRLRLGEILAGMLPEFGSSGSSRLRKMPGRWIESIFLGGSVLGCLGWIWWYGGLKARLSSGYAMHPAGGALFRIAFVGLIVANLLVAWRLISTRSRRISDLILAGGLVLFDIFHFWVIVANRRDLMQVFLGVLVILLLRRGKAALPKIPVAVITTVFLIHFSVWGSIRHKPLTTLMGMQPDMYAAPASAPYQGYVQAVSAPFSGACLAFEIFPHVEPFKHGSTVLVTLLGFIPRAVWPDKPVGLGKEITRYIVGPYYEPVYGYSVAVTLPVDFYVNFGWFGVVLGGLLLGLVCRTVAVYAVTGMRDRKQFRAARVLIPAVFAIGLMEVRGEMSSAGAFYALSFLPVLFALTFFRLDYPEGEEQAN